MHYTLTLGNQEQLFEKAHSLAWTNIQMAVFGHSTCILLIFFSRGGSINQSITGFV